MSGNTAKEKQKLIISLFLVILNLLYFILLLIDYLTEISLWYLRLIPGIAVLVTLPIILYYLFFEIEEKGISIFLLFTFVTICVGYILNILLEINSHYLNIFYFGINSICLIYFLIKISFVENLRKMDIVKIIKIPSKPLKIKNVYILGFLLILLSGFMVTIPFDMNKSPFTEFSIVTGNNSVLNANKTNLIVVEISNHEGRDINYTVILLFNDTYINSTTAFIKNEYSENVSITFIPRELSNNIKLRLQLYIFDSPNLLLVDELFFWTRIIEN